MRPSLRSIRTAVGNAATLAALLLTTSAAACSSDAPAADANATPAVLASRTPTYTVEVVRTLPHDIGSYTEGLMFHEGRLFESTGQPGHSHMREVDLETGKAIRQRDLPEPYFGEGIVIFGDKIYELTWQHYTAFVYNWKTFEPTGQFKYEGEGWALTTDGTSLIMSNGTSVIAYRDPKTFAVTRTLEVTDHDVPVQKLNELEWIKGEIWANVWESDQIARIDPATGHVLGWIDLAGILPAADRNGKEDVLNGIAYDDKNDKIYVTGKNWSKLFEIKLKQRS